MNHQTSTVPQVIPQVAYQSPQAPTQLMTKSSFVDSGFVVPVFYPGDDLIACLNKAMAFLTDVASLRFPSTNNQLRTSSNLRNQATIQDDKVTVQCTQPKQPRNALWYKEKAMLAEAQEVGQILDEEQLAFLVDLGIPAGQAQTIIPHNAAFQTEDLDTYDSDCDDLSTTQAVLMANISTYGSDVISEVPNSETYMDDMDNQSVHALHDFEQSQVMDFFTDNEISSQSAQTVHMLTKPQAFYDNTHKQALGYQNPFYLKKAQRIKLTLYDGVVMSNTHVAMPVIDDEETLILEEGSRSKILAEDFGKCFSPQQELSAEHAFWFHILNPSIESSYTPPVIVDVPSELPKVSLVNASLKKLKFHLTQFDSVVKKRTTPNALEEGEWGTLNPQPLQSLPYLDITLSLSPITPLENLSSPPSPSPPPPQPPIMGHPLYYNYHDYHGSTCICCFHNRNLYLNLRDEMNIMFAHLEYLLTISFTTYFPPPP
ncbi:hypothetical protein Tco_0701302 [Tanacetum coccineum]